MMKPILAVLSAAILLSACAENALDEPPSAYADVDYDGWYDGFYGPFVGGFWGPHDRFYYDDGGRHFHPDRGGHFRHSGGPGLQAIHGHAPMHMGGGHAGGGGRHG
jgi:hypothetical protein